jgi:hypothetical protein
MTTNQLDRSKTQSGEQRGTCDPALQLELVLAVAVAICSEATMRKTVRLFDLGQSTMCESAPCQLIYRQSCYRAPPDNTLPRDTVWHARDNFTCADGVCRRFRSRRNGKISLKHRARNGTTAHLYERGRHLQKARRTDCVLI